MEMVLLQMTEADKLAANCPRCFGPIIPGSPLKPGEPGMVCCIDANFQQRRHKAASVPIQGSKPETPELFMEPELVDKMAEDIHAGRPEIDDALVVSLCQTMCIHLYSKLSNGFSFCMRMRNIRTPVLINTPPQMMFVESSIGQEMRIQVYLA